jgi:hypothetical protein
MTPKNLAGEALGPISLDRAAKLPAGRDTQPRHCPAVDSDKQRHEPSRDSNAGRVRPLKVGTPTDPLGNR